VARERLGAEIRQERIIEALLGLLVMGVAMLWFAARRFKKTAA